MRSGVFTAHHSLLGSRWRLALCAFLAVTAVVVGLLAMHTVVGHASHGAAGGAAVTETAAGHGHGGAGMHETSAGAGPAHHDDAAVVVVCDEACQMGCLMIGLMCTLALLAVLVGFRLPRVAVDGHSAMGLRRVARVRPARMARRTPPSLTALSICRT